MGNFKHDVTYYFLILNVVRMSKLHSFCGVAKTCLPSSKIARWLKILNNCCYKATFQQTSQSWFILKIIFGQVVENVLALVSKNHGSYMLLKLFRVSFITSNYYFGSCFIPEWLCLLKGEKNNGYEVLYHTMKHGINSSRELAEFIRDRSGNYVQHSLIYKPHKCCLHSA